MLISEVESFLKKYDLLQPNTNVIVAFSGGYDSMCLLHIMKKISQNYKINLYAIHLNHNWRGEESDKEELSCKDFCKDINFYSEKLPTTIAHTETAAREARYDFFKNCAKKFNSKVILTAHNANDNAETVFYRIIKGTGITGLEGIHERRDIFYRPLIRTYRNEIEEYCKKNKLTPNIDSSNFNTHYTRNKIRYKIFPLIKEISEEFEKNLNQLSQTASDTNATIEAELKDLEKYSAEEFRNSSTFFQNAIVHKFLRKQNIEYDRKKIEEIVEFILKNRTAKSGKKYSLTKNLWLFVNNKKIALINNNKNEFSEIEIKSEGEYEIGGYKFSLTKHTQKPKHYPPDKNMTAFVELKNIDFTLRQRKNGDIIQPLGMKGKQKLKKYLTEKEIPKHEKDKLILLCSGCEVLWAPGFGISDKIKVVTTPTHMLKLEYRKVSDEN